LHISVNKYARLLPGSRARLVSFRLDGTMLSETSPSEPFSGWPRVVSGELDLPSFAFDTAGTVGIELETRFGPRLKASCGLSPFRQGAAYFLIEPVVVQVVKTERRLTETISGSVLKTMEEPIEFLSAIAIRPLEESPSISSG